MTRVVRTAAERREEILDVAERLILTTGYQRMTVQDVLDRVGIAKGTLYHHFAGKEAILQGIVDRETGAMAARARAAAEASAGQAALSRLLGVLAALAVESGSPAGELAEHFNDTRNAEFHVLVLNAALHQVAPVLAGVIADGVAAGEMSVPDPLGAAEVILALGSTLLDEGMVPATEAERARREQVVAVAGVRLLGAGPDAVAQGLGTPAGEGNHA